MRVHNIFTLIAKILLNFVLLISMIHVVIAGENVTWEFETEYYSAVTEYKVVNAKVDPATFTGWSFFHNLCVGCHGVGGSGTELAPDLTQSVSNMGPGRFNKKVLHKDVETFSPYDWYDMERSMFEEIMRQEKGDSNESVKMPHWENNPAVRENVHNIYRYLKARSDGIIGTGKPEVMNE